RYMDVAGRRYPRKQDIQRRAEQLCHDLEGEADGLGRAAKRSVGEDVERIRAFVRDLDRGPTRGLAIFACSEAGLWQDLRLARPVRDRASLAEHPYVLPLEALLETYEAFCTVVVDKERARLFVARTGSITEESEVFDDVPGRHD